ncbi:MAG TPA: cyclic nucleotide-binding domain-containing protein, partial [Alphaproteobacteria bacterium]|nr:cyclic nucleotide-binding domain-containing protein [Alphaproteobacteria bacterium]
MSLEDFLSEHTQTQPFTAGELIVSQGAPGQAAYYVLDGFVKVFRPLGEKEALVARLGPGSIFGE